MRTYTNMTWPDDPYRPGPHPHRRPAPLLAAFGVAPPARGGSLAPMAAAIVYLPLHRTRPVSVVGQALAFGFRAVSIGDDAEVPALVRVADLDLMQARCHAAILAGHMLATDLAAIRQAAGETVLRGITAVEQEWGDRHEPTTGTALMFDCLHDLPGVASLAGARRKTRIASGTGWYLTGLENLDGGDLYAAMAVEQALTIALACAKYLDRYSWEGKLPIDDILAAGALDCFPGPRPDLVVLAGGRA